MKTPKLHRAVQHNKAQSVNSAQHDTDYGLGLLPVRIDYDGEAHSNTTPYKLPLDLVHGTHPTHSETHIPHNEKI